MVYCRYCGTALPDDSVFCYQCGKDLTVKKTGSETQEPKIEKQEPEIKMQEPKIEKKEPEKKCRLTVRLKNAGQNENAKVFLDDQVVGGVSSAADFTTFIFPGHHTLRLKGSSGGGNPAELRVGELNTETICVFAVNPLSQWGRYTLENQYAAGNAPIFRDENSGNNGTLEVRLGGNAGLGEKPTVFLDDQPIGKVSVSSVLTVPVSAGVHTVYLKGMAGGGRAADIRVEPAGGRTSCVFGVNITSLSERYVLENAYAGGEGSYYSADMKDADPPFYERHFKLIVAVAVFLVVLIGGTSLGLFGGSSSSNAGTGGGDQVVIQGDTSGKAKFKVWLMDASTYNVMSEYNLTPTTNQFQDLTTFPWEQTTVTVYEASNYVASSLSAKQGNQVAGQYTQQIMLFQAIANGSARFSAMNMRYQLVALYINNQPASVYTYLHNGDEVKAIIVFSNY